jgi:hypothetical protein
MVDSLRSVPAELRDQFQQLFTLKVEHAPFDDGVFEQLDEAAQKICNTSTESLTSSFKHINLIVLLKNRSTREILAFVTVILNTSNNVAVVSSICAAYDNHVAYDICVHGLLARELLEMGIAEIALSSTENQEYYEYLGYRKMQIDSNGRIVVRTFNGAAMVMEDIASSKLIQIFPEKLERTLGILQSVRGTLSLQGQLKQSSNSKNLSQFWTYSLRHTSEVLIDELEWSYKIPPNASVLENGWFTAYSAEERKAMLRDATWISAFKLNKSTVATPYAFVMAKEHSDVVELFPFVVQRIGKTETDIPRALLMIATLLMLRFLKRQGFKKAFAVGVAPDLLKQMGFHKRKPWKNLIVPAAEDFYVLNLQRDLKQITAELISFAWQTHQRAISSTTTVEDFLLPDFPLHSISKAKALEKAKIALGELHEHTILGGLVTVEARWKTERTSKGKQVVEAYVLNARVFLREDANWLPPDKPNTILAQLKQVVANNSQFSRVYPAIGYFSIIYEAEPLAVDANLDVRMGQFYSALALLPTPPYELKGFMAIALGTVLIDELRRETILPNMTFGLEASGELGNKSMHGLVDYYQNTLGLQVVRPQQLEQDINEGSVIMMASVADVVNACAKKFQKLT